jgi:hypothetical protein
MSPVSGYLVRLLDNPSLCALLLQASPLGWARLATVGRLHSGLAQVACLGSAAAGSAALDQVSFAACSVQKL